ncbi:MAG: hypothetical protein JJU34_01015 [Lunatimonas sp.]|uniref:hypothetical protein n=1 Tax=Lunatimonas sp. TaxID=2060141 RepID=UPI00263B83B5|nr:hypothetical protein [Lunatimonas sp.]MCC5935836.1 hypothetical protein [Lunatimonas sp.]
MFDQFYSQANDMLRLAFLEEAFRQHPELKEEFIAFYLKPTAMQLKLTVEDPDDFIFASTDLIIQDLETPDFDELAWHRVVQRHRSPPEESGYEATWEENHLNGVISFHISLLEGYCTQRHFDLAYLYLISLYEACYEVVLTEEQDLLPDLRSILLDLLIDNLQPCMPLFKSIQLSSNQLFTVSTAVLDFFVQHRRQHAGFLRFFEPFLEAIIHTGTEAAIVLDVVESRNAADHLSWLYTELQRKAGGNQAWEKSARRYYKRNRSVASSLLAYYETSNKAEFARIAGELWRNGLFQEEFAQRYFEGMDPGADPALYREVVLYLNRWRFSEVYYRVLMNLMDSEERMSYLETFRWNKSAYVSGLCLERRYPEALRFAEVHCNRWNLQDILEPCLIYQPHKALLILEAKIEELLGEVRDRDFYQRVAWVLLFASDIPEIREDASALIVRLYRKYSRLRAFRSELRNAGLMDG